MNYSIDKKLILEFEAEFEPEVASQAPEEDDTSYAKYAALPAIGAVGATYALNKERIDPKVKAFVDAKKADAKYKVNSFIDKSKANVTNAATNFAAGAQKGYQNPGRFQKNDRSQAEVVGHDLGQGARRFQKKATTTIKDKLQAYRR